MCPKDRKKGSEKTRGHDLGGVAEDARFVQLREEDTEG